MKKIWILILALSLVLASLTGCSPSAPKDDTANNQPNQENNQSNDQSKDQSNADADNKDNDKEPEMAESQTLRMAINTSPAGRFNPALTTDNTEAYVTSLIFEPMVIVNPDYTISSGLAKSWDISEDSKTVTFSLVENAKWQDGTPFTAKDVEFTLKFAGHPDYPGQFYTKVSSIKGMKEFNEGKADTVEGIKVINDYQIEITTTDVHAPFLMDIAYVPIIAEHIWGKVDIAGAFEQTELLLNPVGTGPFKLDTFVADQYTKLVRYDEYRAGAPKLDGILLEIVNAETAQAKLLNNETDLISVGDMNEDDLAMYEQANIPLYTTYWTSYREIGLNLRNELFNDKNVRKALIHALDRQGVCDSIYNGYATVANTIYAPFYWAYPGDDALINYEYDPEKAKNMLVEAGWEYKDGKMYAGGNPVSFNLITTSSKQTDLILVVFQENFKNIGIDLKIEQVEFATQLDMLRNGEGYDMFFLGNGTGNDADGRLLFRSDSVGKGNNFTAYNNPKIDELLDEGVKYMDIEDRKPVYAEIAKIINDELPSLFICNWGSATATNAKLKGYIPSSNAKYVDIINWYFEK